MGDRIMRQLLLLLILSLISFEVFGAYSKDTWKNTDNYTELVRSGAPVKIDGGCFRYDSGKMQSSNDCILYENIGSVNALNDIADVDVTGATDGQALVYDFGTATWIAGTIDALPAQASQEHKILRTDGTTASWSEELLAWQPSTLYRTGDVVTESNSIYKCVTPNSDATFTPSNWQSLGGGTLPTDLVNTDETTILDNFLVAWDSVAKKIKKAGNSILDGVLKAAGFVGPYTERANFAVQQGDAYNSTDSTLAGTSKVATSGSGKLILATYTPDGTNFGSLIAFDSVSDPEIKKGAWYGAKFNYGISGDTDGLYSVNVYDNGVAIGNAVILDATDDQNAPAKVTFTMPSSPTKLQLIATDLSATTEALTITSIQWTSDPLVTMDIRQEDVLVEAAGNAGQTVGAGAGIPFILSSESDTGSWDGINFTATTDGRYLVSGATFWNGPTVTGIVLYKGITAIKYIGLGASSTVVPFSGAIDLIAGESIAVVTDSGGTLVNAPTIHTLSITAIATGSSKGYVQGADIPLENYTWPSYDESEVTVTGTSSWAPVKVSLTPERDSAGNMFISGSINGTSSAVTGITVTIPSVTTWSVKNPVLLSVNAGSPNDARFTEGTGQIVTSSTGGSPTEWRLEFSRTPITSWPTWATKKNSFTGTIVVQPAIPGTPATSSDSCMVGEIKVDASYIYVCRATDTWVRSSAATW